MRSAQESVALVLLAMIGLTEGVLLASEPGASTMVAPIIEGGMDREGGDGVQVLKQFADLMATEPASAGGAAKEGIDDPLGLANDPLDVVGFEDEGEDAGSLGSKVSQLEAEVKRLEAGSKSLDGKKEELDKLKESLTKATKKDDAAKAKEDKAAEAENAAMKKAGNAGQAESINQKIEALEGQLKAAQHEKKTLGGGGGEGGDDEEGGDEEGGDEEEGGEEEADAFVEKSTQSKPTDFRFKAKAHHKRAKHHSHSSHNSHKHHKKSRGPASRMRKRMNTDQS